MRYARQVRDCAPFTLRMRPRVLEQVMLHTWRSAMSHDRRHRAFNRHARTTCFAGRFDSWL